MTEFLELLKKRRSIRDFEDKDVPLEIINEIIKESCMAPSSANGQPWRFIIINDKDVIKSRQLLKFKEVTHAIFIRPGTTAEQIKGILDYLDIKDSLKPFSRCLRCNSVLKNVSKESVAERIPPKTKELCDQYTYCKFCDKVYWKGTHFIKMNKAIEHILSD